MHRLHCLHWMISIPASKVHGLKTSKGALDRSMMTPSSCNWMCWGRIMVSPRSLELSECHYVCQNLCLNVIYSLQGFQNRYFQNRCMFTE